VDVVCAEQGLEPVEPFEVPPGHPDHRTDLPASVDPVLSSLLLPEDLGWVPAGEHRGIDVLLPPVELHHDTDVGEPEVDAVDRATVSELVLRHDDDEAGLDETDRGERFPDRLVAPVEGRDHRARPS